MIKKTPMASQLSTYGSLGIDSRFQHLKKFREFTQAK